MFGVFLNHTGFWRHEIRCQKNVECGRSLVSLTNSLASCTCALVSTAPSGCTLSGALQKCFLLALLWVHLHRCTSRWKRRITKVQLHVFICSLKGNEDLAKCWGVQRTFPICLKGSMCNPGYFLLPATQIWHPLLSPYCWRLTCKLKCLSPTALAIYFKKPQS